MMHKELTLNLPLISSAAILVFVGLSFLSLVVPLSLGHPQWLVGTIVNACLFLSAIFLPKKFFLPLIIFPSLGVLARGIVFGPLTPFLVYFLPFIWLGNLILVLLFKKLYANLDKKLSFFKYFLPVFCAAAAKCLFLLASAEFYFQFHLIPKFFLQAMGLSQFLTALSGGLISWVIFNAYGQYHTRNQRTA